MNNDAPDQSHHKILFRLEKDEDGYPPNEWETLWAVKVGPDLYRIDNIPFFVLGVSLNDIVSVTTVGKELHFKDLVEPSGHSVLRVIIYDKARMTQLRAELKRLGCDTELSHIDKLVSADVPPSVSIAPILDFLVNGKAQDILDYEEASIAHDRTSNG